MKKILVVNREKYGQDLLPEFEITQKLIQNTSWILKQKVICSIGLSNKFGTCFLPKNQPLFNKEFLETNYLRGRAIEVFCSFYFGLLDQKPKSII